MKHPIFMCICLLCVLFALAGCQARTAMPLDTSEESASSADDSERTENTNDSTLTRDGEQITIRSLADWEEFNYDGNFSDNCLLFLSHLIGEGSDFMEFDTVKISDYTIVRDPKAYEQYQLYFEFTVSESQLDTLPKGAYRTLVSDTVDCFVEFLDEDPRAGHPKAELPESGERFYQMLQTWIYSAYGWDCPPTAKRRILPCCAILSAGSTVILPNWHLRSFCGSQKKNSALCQRKRRFPNWNP